MSLIENLFKGLFNDRKKSVDAMITDYDLINIDSKPPMIGSTIKTVRLIHKGVKIRDEQLDSVYFMLEQDAEFIAENDDPLFKVHLYTYAVYLLKLVDRKILASRFIKFSIILLEISIKIDNKYFQAYNKLGVCWSRLEAGQKMAISCFRTSIKYCNDAIGREDPNYAPATNFKGDNYLNIGLCLLRLNRKQEAIAILKQAQRVAESDYLGFTEAGFNSWRAVFNFADGYDCIEIDNENDSLERKYYLDIELKLAAELRRFGWYEEAETVYRVLDQEFPNCSQVLKEWARVLIGVGKKDVAVIKLKQAIVGYESLGEKAECDNCKKLLDEANEK